MNIPDHISESLKNHFCVKILKFYDADPDPGCGMEKIRIRDSCPGSVTLDLWGYLNEISPIVSNFFMDKQIWCGTSWIVVVVGLWLWFDWQLLVLSHVVQFWRCSAQGLGDAGTASICHGTSRWCQLIPIQQFDSQAQAHKLIRPALYF